ncbi:MAG: hypothetical protein GY834_16750 [Bacteroidetes bacterium]|nr:hypothetical protein [Bacteroidota bacterium]
MSRMCPIAYRCENNIGLIAMPFNSIKLITTILIAIALCGCSGVSQEDITSELKFWGGYKYGDTYTLRENIFLLNIILDGQTYYALSPEGGFKKIDRYYSVPMSIKDYKDGHIAKNTVTGRYYQARTEVIDFVKKGTSIECVKLLKKLSKSWFFGETARIVVFAKIIDGPHAGLEVDLSDISKIRVVDDIKINWPNDNLLILNKTTP